MRDVTLERDPVNVPALDAALRAAFGTLVIGVSATRTEVTVYLTDEATIEQMRQVHTLLVAHDASQLTPEQIAAQRRLTQLQQLRAANAEPLDPADFVNAAAPVQILAARLMWLEEELRDIRGLA